MTEFDTTMEPISFECRWAPKVDFEWTDADGKLVGSYHVGNVYNCSKLPVHANLRVALANWHKAGIVELYPLKYDQSFVITQQESII